MSHRSNNSGRYLRLKDRVARVLRNGWNVIDDAASWVYGAMLGVIFWTGFLATNMSFDIPGDEQWYLGPYPLVAGMIFAIGYLAKRDKEMRDQLRAFNDERIKSLETRNRELEQQLRDNLKVNKTQ